MNTMRHASGEGYKDAGVALRRLGLGIAAAGLLVAGIAACGGAVQPSGPHSYDTEVIDFGSDSPAATSVMTSSLPPSTTSPSRESSRRSSSVPSTATRSTLASSAARSSSPSETPTTLGPVIVSTVPLNPTKAPTTARTTSAPGTSSPSTSPENNPVTGLAGQAATVANRLSQLATSGEATMITPKQGEATNSTIVYFVSKKLQTGTPRPEVTAQVSYHGNNVVGVALETGIAVVLPGEYPTELSHTASNNDKTVQYFGDGGNWSARAFVGNDEYATYKDTNAVNVVPHLVGPDDIQSRATDLLGKF